MAGAYIRKLISDRQGAALVLTLLVSGIMMITALAIITVAGDDFQIAAYRSHASQAKYVADSAVEIIKQQIVEAEKQGLRFTATNEAGPRVPGGTYTYTVIPPETEDNPYLIKVQAKVSLVNGELVRKKIEVEYIFDEDNGNTPPPISNQKAWNFQLFQGGGTGVLHLSSDTFKGSGKVYSQSKIILKPDNANKKPFDFQGTISSARDIQTQPLGYIPPGLELNEYEVLVPSPTINWNRIKEAAELLEASGGTKKVYSGDQILDGSTLSGVVFIDGDLILSGNVDQNTLIAATGDVTVVGDYGFPNSDYTVVGIIAGGDLELRAEDTVPRKQTDNGPRIRGFAIGVEDVIINGYVEVNGSLMACNRLTFTSGRLEFKSSSESPSQVAIERFGTDLFTN